jgi:DNA polymerase-3 subunit delta'
MPFDSFLGNPQAVEALREMLASGRMPPALLFAGPEGVGKKTLALMLAKALNCERRRDDFCGECGRCRQCDAMIAAAREDLARRRETKDAARRLDGLVYFDVQLIEPLTRYILIEQIRQLRHIAYTRPFQLPRRVFVVDDAQAIHWQAADLLLKVLEEPPDTTTLILVCPNAYELRATFRSRCRRVAFHPVEEATLRTVLAADGKVPEARRALVARLAAGSIAAARSFDPEAFERRRRPWVQFLDSLVGSPAGRRRALDWKSISEAAKALGEDRSTFEQTLRIGYSLLSDLLRVVENQPESAVTNIDLLPQLKTWAVRLGLEGVEKLKNGLDQAYRLQTRNVNQQLGFETMAIDLEPLVSR